MTLYCVRVFPQLTNLLDQSPPSPWPPTSTNTDACKTSFTWNLSLIPSGPCPAPLFPSPPPPVPTAPNFLLLTLCVVRVDAATADSISLHWQKPEQDNGSPVTSYQLEFASVPAGRVAPTYHKAYNGKNTNCTVSQTTPLCLIIWPLVFV